MSGKHHTATDDEHRMQSAFLDALASDLGIPWRGRGNALAKACGVSADRIRKAYSGRVRVNMKTLGAWRTNALSSNKSEQG